MNCLVIRLISYLFTVTYTYYIENHQESFLEELKFTTNSIWQNTIIAHFETLLISKYWFNNPNFVKKYIL